MEDILSSSSHHPRRGKHRHVSKLISASVVASVISLLSWNAYAQSAHVPMWPATHPADHAYFCGVNVDQPMPDGYGPRWKEEMLRRSRLLGGDDSKARSQLLKDAKCREVQQKAQILRSAKPT